MRMRKIGVDHNSGRFRDTNQEGRGGEGETRGVSSMAQKKVRHQPH